MLYTTSPSSQKKRTPELLAPAGGFEQLQYALHFGADAVYLGGARFGLRVRADNFSDDELLQAVTYAHSFGAKVHVTVNAIMHQRDLSVLREYLERLEAIQPDALIVTDLATIQLAQELVPSAELHISTQASCANAQAALAYYHMGAKRVVLARELTVAEIADIRSAVPDDLELEVFAHGAMCMAYSGRCIISNHLNGRDANAGHCTQPCRWTYALTEKKRPGEYFPVEESSQGSFILSSKDLMMLDHLDDLTQAGVDSIKIEGRVKGAYYVATVVNAYRQVLDGADPQEFLSELDAVSHRPYHTGFFYGQPDQTKDLCEYNQNRQLVGTVISCDPLADAGMYRVTFMQRNRIFSGEEIEVLSPGKPVRRFTPTHFYDEWNVQTDRAHRACDIYSVDCPFALEPLDILRKQVEIAQ